MKDSEKLIINTCVGDFEAIENFNDFTDIEVLELLIKRYDETTFYCPFLVQEMQNRNMTEVYIKGIDNIKICLQERKNKRLYELEQMLIGWNMKGVTIKQLNERNKRFMFNTKECNKLHDDVIRLQTALDEANERLARSVELPCKVGDVIYTIEYGKIVEFKVEVIKILSHLTLIINETLDKSVWLRSYNKTWFTDKNKALEVLNDECV